MFWSVIAENKRKTVSLIVLMGFFLISSGSMIGMALADAQHPYAAGLIGAAVAGAVWVVMLLVSLFASDSVLLGLTHAREVTRDMYPQLINVVEEMVIAGSLPHMPRIFVVDDPSPNAFAVGKSPEKSCICVTAGLLALCDRDELQGVVAHEIGHIMNRDVLYMTVAATMLGSILFISDMFVRSFRYTSTTRLASRSRRAGGGAAGPLLIVSLLLAIIGPILARVLYFSISRRREYLADATSARLTRYPEGLASALEKIGQSPVMLSAAPSAVAPFYTVNPYRQHISSGAFATHPPLSERIQILRAMSHGAGYTDYLKAYARVTRRRRALLPPADLTERGKVDIRQASRDGCSAPATRAESLRRARDIIRALNDFAFITCACGLRIKVAPEYPKDRIACPRCSRVHSVQRSGAAAVGSVLSASSAMGAPAAARVVCPDQGGGHPSERAVQEARFVPGRWQKIACEICGHGYEISPRFSGRRLVCSGCGAVIRFSRAAGQGDGSSGIPA